MNKIFDIIPLNNYLYMVDKEAEIPQYSWFYASDRNSIHDNRWKTYSDGNHLKKDFPFYWLILASNDPALKDLPLLPPIKEDISEIIQKAKEKYPYQTNTTEEDKGLILGLRLAYIDGYKAAKAKKYSEEDMWWAYTRGFQASEEKKKPLTDFREVIQSFNPVPIQVEVEMWDFADSIEKMPEGKLKENLKKRHENPKLDNNNTVIVKRYIYGT